MSGSVWPHRRQPTRLPRPWDSPGKNTGVGWHFLLQCMKVKSESEVAQLCPTLSEPMDCSLPGSSIHGIFQARVLEWGAIAFSDVMFKRFLKPRHLFLFQFYFFFFFCMSFFFFNFILFLNFTILYWFCQISKWIHHRYTCVPHPEPSSLLPPHTIPLGHPSTPAPSIQYCASNLDWRLISYMIVYMFQCHSPKSSHPLPLPQSP